MNHNIYIYGAGYYGRVVLEKLRISGYEAVGFIDGNKDFNEYLGLPVISPCCVQDESAKYIIAVKRVDMAQKMARALLTKGIDNIYFAYNIGEETGDFFQENCVKIDKIMGTALNHVEMHVMDACNLNCRGCTHFSPLFSKGIPDFSSRIQDIKKLSEKVDCILKFYILGGEPFLNPELPLYLKEIRGLLPETKIILMSNGLLIPTANAETMEAIKENNIKVKISEYSPTHKYKEEITSSLEKYSIAYEYSGIAGKQMFNIPISISENSKYPQKCISDGCVNIWNGKIARCPTLMYISEFNKRFATNLPTDGVYNLDSDMDGGELVKKLREKVPLCKHCIEYKIPWSACSKDKIIEDFAVKE